MILILFYSFVSVHVWVSLKSSEYIQKAVELHIAMPAVVVIVVVVVVVVVVAAAAVGSKSCFPGIVAILDYCFRI